MKSLTILYALLQDASKSLGADMTRDWITIQSRLQSEGLSFLTITLPTFTSWLEQSLEAGHTLPTIYSSFRRAKNRSFPCFMQGLVKCVFDSRTGDLLSEADPSAVFFIRSICSLFKKVKLPCTKVRNDKAVKKFVDTDESLPVHIELDNVTRSVAYVVLESLRFFESDNSLPKHGKGATFERVTGNRKYEVRDFYERWKDIVSPEDLYGWNRIGEKDVTVVRQDQEKPCRLSLVPKTLKSPRIIAVEPVAMQYAQQLCADKLIRSMQRSKYTRHIDFTDQSVNRKLAYKGSVDGSVATIDLSEASDRVSLSLVHELFGSEPEILAELLAFRSNSVKLPEGLPFNGMIMPLRKYSTSGSALTFPVETLVFYILSLSAVVRRNVRSYRSLRSAISNLAQTVNVYGDDIVVPTDACSQVIGHLESYGLKVNQGKTFWKGSFRESCGGDYFKGYDVTPTYLKHQLPDDLSKADPFESSVASSNLLWSRGCWFAADAIRKAIDVIFRLPIVLPTSPGLGWTNRFNSTYSVTKVLRNNNYGVRTVISGTKPRSDVLSGYSALLKHFLSRGVQEDSEHLLQTVPRYRNRLRIGWVTPY